MKQLISSILQKDTKVCQDPAKIASPRGEQNIFASLSAGLMEGVSESNKTKTADVVKNESETFSDDSLVKTSKEEIKSESAKSEKEIDETVKIENVSEKTNSVSLSAVESEVKDNENILKLEDYQQFNAVKSGDIKTEEHKSESDSKEKLDGTGDVREGSGHTEEKKHSEAHKRHDSEDSKSSHSHHHHHHRRHPHEKRESVSEDLISQKNESHDRKDSSSRRQSHDRRDSHSQDRDRKSSKSHRDKDRYGRKSSDSRDKKDSVKDRKDSSSGINDSTKKNESSKDRRESVGSVSSDKTLKQGESLKKVGKLSKDGKGKVKKSKKAEELPIDVSMADLFMPDNLPAPPKDEVKIKTKKDKEKDAETVEEKERVSKVTFKDEILKSSMKIKTNTEQENSAQPEIIKVEEQDLDECPDINEDKTPILNTEQSKENMVKKELQAGEKDSSQFISDNVQKVDSNILVSDKGIVKTKSDGEMEETGVLDKSKDASVLEEIKLEEKSDNSTISEVKYLDKDKDNEETGEEKTDVDVELMQDVVEEKPEDVLVIDVRKPKQDTETKVTKDNLILEKKNSSTEENSVQKKQKLKGPLKMSDFFSERRLKINDPKPRPKVVKEETAKGEGSENGEEGTGRRKRNKAKAFAEILKKEKLGSGKSQLSR